MEILKYIIMMYRFKCAQMSLQGPSPEVQILRFFLCLMPLSSVFQLYRGGVKD